MSTRLCAAREQGAGAVCARDDHCTPGGLTCVPCSKLLPQITRITGRIYKVTSRHHEAASNDVLTTSLHSENFHKSHLITEGETEARRGEVPAQGHTSMLHLCTNTSLHMHLPRWRIFLPHSTFHQGLGGGVDLRPQDQRLPIRRGGLVHPVWAPRAALISLPLASFNLPASRWLWVHPYLGHVALSPHTRLPGWCVCPSPPNVRAHHAHLLPPTTSLGQMLFIDAPSISLWSLFPTSGHSGPASSCVGTLATGAALLRSLSGRSDVPGNGCFLGAALPISIEIGM